MKILVPVDGSLLAESAFSLACGLARRWKAELLVLRVVDPHVPGQAGQLGLAQQLSTAEQESAGDYLEQLARMLVHRGVTGTTRVEFGQPASMIARVAREEQVELIAMSSHGRTGPKRWLLGSVAEGVLRVSPSPVLLCRGSLPKGFEGFRSVVVPVDGSSNSIDVLGQLGPYLHTEARVLLVRATDDLVRSSALNCDSDSYQAYLDALDAELAALDPQARYERRVLDAPPAEAILEAAAADRADLIAMSTHGRTGYHRLLIGSVTERVARHASCPMLVFPAQTLMKREQGSPEPSLLREPLPL